MDPNTPAFPPAATTAAGRVLGQGAYRGGSWHDEELLHDARQTDSFRQFIRCFPRWLNVTKHVTTRALKRLADNVALDPNDPGTWYDEIAHATAVMRRHGISQVDPWSLTTTAIGRLIDTQAEADATAGLDWATVTVPAAALDDKLRQAHTNLAIDLDDPAIWRYRDKQRKALARKLGLDSAMADDLSRCAIANPAEFDPEALRCWRIASERWLQIAATQLDPVGYVQRPIGVFVTPGAQMRDHERVDCDGWQLSPVFSLEMIRLIATLGGTVGRDLITARLPRHAIPAFLAQVNVNALHAGPRELMDSKRQLGAELTRHLGQAVVTSSLVDKVDRWGRVHVHRHSYTDRHQVVYDELSLGVMTAAIRGFTQRRLGSATDHRVTRSAVMELGEAVNTAVEHGLAILLSTEAAGHLAGRVRVGRMKGKPGMVTITRSDGASATTERVVAEQAVARLRTLKQEGASVVLDAGARQVVRMTLARGLDDDPVLLGRQREVAALMAVGSGVNASQVGTGKTVMTARGGLYHRAATTPRFRALLVAEGRLLGQWRDELHVGAPARGLPPLAPNVALTVLDEHSSIAGQIRQFDRELGDRPGALLVPNSVMDRYAADLCAIDYHLLIADEALRYVNPATEAHRALKRVRMSAAADCWLLTATPRGRTAEHLDVLVGLSVGDEAMIAERLNTREAGDLMDELNAHRLRVNYGPHLVRVTREDMKAWMPDVRPAEPMVVEADGALLDLLEAIRQGGRDAYRRLIELLGELKNMDKGCELYLPALAEISRVQGAVLGNVGVYVDASIDPETLLHSEAALAKALKRTGLIEAAMRGGGDGLPLLRAIVAQTLAGVAGEEQVLVFADRVKCLRQLARTITERHGVQAHVADGSIDEADFEDLKRRFIAGEFPVLCLSKVGQEGHNLQNASVIVHYDLPWLQTTLEQRVGRAARPGNTRGYVQTYIPYIKAAGIEHVVSILAERGAEHHQILDSFEGVKASESTIATQLGQITSQVADSKDQAGYAGTAAKLRVAANVFGH
jgi:hypothetical protein